MTIADGVEIGANVIVYDDVSIDSGSQIHHGAVLGRPSTYQRGSSEPPPTPGKTVIGAGATVGTYALIGTTAELAPHSFVGDHCAIREGVRIGADSMIGSACSMGRDCEIGERTRMQRNTVLGRRTVIEDDCFIGIAVQLMSGRTMSDAPAPGPPVLRRGCQIGGGALILPGVEIGEEAVVGAGAVVIDDVAAGARVMGVPARAH